MGCHIILSVFVSSSPSSLTSKKSNELIQGGLSSIKSAATTMVKKMEEIKEAMSTNSTPVKVASDRLAAGDASECAECESNDGSDCGGDRHRKISAEMSSYKGSFTNLKEYDENLPESLFPTPKEDKNGKQSITFISLFFKTSLKKWSFTIYRYSC